MKTYLTAWLVTGLVLLALDAVWLSTMANRLYRPQLGALLADGFAPMPAILFYLIFVTGLVFFAVRPGLAAGSWQTAAIHGLLFGFCAYATYDLTNHATLRNWPVAVTVVDMAWGTVLSGLSATVGFAAAHRLAG